MRKEDTLKQKPTQKQDVKLYVYKKQAKRFIVRDAMLEVDGRDRSYDGLNIIKMYDEKVRKPLYNIPIPAHLSPRPICSNEIPSLRDFGMEPSADRNNNSISVPEVLVIEEQRKGNPGHSEDKSLSSNIAAIRAAALELLTPLLPHQAWHSWPWPTAKSERAGDDDVEDEALCIEIPSGGKKQQGKRSLKSTNSLRVLNYAKDSYTQPFMLPPYQKLPYLPPSLKLKSAFFSSPSLSIQFNPYVPDGPKYAVNADGTYPGQALEKHSEEWAARRRVLHAISPSRSSPTTEPSHSATTSEAFYLSHDLLNSTLETYDLLLTIAHCSHCHDHISLRHNCAGYHSKAGELLELLSREIIAYNPLARVGILRLKRAKEVQISTLGGTGTSPSAFPSSPQSPSGPIVRQTKLSMLYRSLSSARIHERNAQDQQEILACSEKERDDDEIPQMRGRRRVQGASSSEGLRRGSHDDDDDDDDGPASQITSRRHRSRIPLGSFEIQISYKRPAVSSAEHAHAGIVTGMLHSKLASRKWPSARKVIVRLGHFLASYVDSLGNQNQQESREHSDAAEEEAPESLERDRHCDQNCEATPNDAGVSRTEMNPYPENSNMAEHKRPPGGGVEYSVRPVTKRVAIDSEFVGFQCTYSDTCQRGCQRSDKIAPLPSGGSGAGTKSSIGTKLSWFLDQSDLVGRHVYSVGDVVDVLLVERSRSERPESCHRSAESIPDGIGVVKAGRRRRVLGSRGTDRSSSPTKSSSPSSSPQPRSLSPLAISEAHRDVAQQSVPMSMDESTPGKVNTPAGQWVEQGYLRGVIMSTHRDGTCDVSFWPDESSSASNKLYTALPCTEQSGPPKQAVEGYVEVGIPPEYIRGLKGASVLITSSEIPDTTAQKRSQRHHRLCFTEYELRSTARPWKTALITRQRDRCDSDEYEGVLKEAYQPLFIA